MKEAKLTIYKILAYGSAKAFMWVKEYPFAISIPKKLYYDLKNLGVPTSQKLSRNNKNAK